MFYRHSTRHESIRIPCLTLILISLTTSMVVMDHFANQSAASTVAIEPRPKQ